MDSSECFEDKSSTKLSVYVTYCADPVKVSTIIRGKYQTLMKKNIL